MTPDIAGMRYVVLTLAVVILPSQALSEPARCLLRVEGKTYIDEPCEVERKQAGGFTIGRKSTRRAAYFASVSTSQEPAIGYWNGNPPESHAHDDLGSLRQVGACYVNEKAIVCADPIR